MLAQLHTVATITTQYGTEGIVPFSWNTFHNRNMIISF